MAYLVGDPTSADVSAVLSANSRIASAFGASASTTSFGLGEMGGAYDVNGRSQSETISDALNLFIDPTKVGNPQDLLIGFYNGAALKHWRQQCKARRNCRGNVSRRRPASTAPTQRSPTSPTTPWISGRWRRSTKETPSPSP